MAENPQDDFLDPLPPLPMVAAEEPVLVANSDNSINNDDRAGLLDNEEEGDPEGQSPNSWRNQDRPR